MTTVAEFIQYLETLPPETKVRVIEMFDGGYSGYYGEFVSLQVDGNTDFTDLTGNRFAVGKSYENDKFLDLGCL